MADGLAAHGLRMRISQLRRNGGDDDGNAELHVWRRSALRRIQTAYGPMWATCEDSTLFSTVTPRDVVSLALYLCTSVPINIQSYRPCEVVISNCYPNYPTLADLKPGLTPSQLATINCNGRRGAKWREFVSAAGGDTRPLLQIDLTQQTGANKGLSIKHRFWTTNNFQARGMSDLYVFGDHRQLDRPAGIDSR